MRRHLTPSLAVSMIAAALTVVVAAPAGANVATPQLDTAAQIVHRDARHYPGSRSNRVAWAAFRYVNRTIDELRAEHDAIDRHIPLPATVEETLRRRAGACGNMTAVMVAIADRLGVRSRPVQAYYTFPNGRRGSHAMAEVYVNGGWRLFDVLSNTVYRSPVTHRLLSLTQIKRMPVKSVLRRADHGYDAGYNHHGPADYFRYIFDRDAEITLNDRGTVTWPSRHTTANIPGYIGQTFTTGTRRSNLSARFTGITAHLITVHLTSACPAGRIVARSGIVSSAPVGLSTTAVTLPVNGPNVVLSVQGDCYVMITSVN